MSVDVIKICEIELDEMWSYVQNKSRQRLLWYAIEYKTSQILAYILKKKKIEGVNKIIKKGNT